MQDRYSGLYKFISSLLLLTTFVNASLYAECERSSTPPFNIQDYRSSCGPCDGGGGGKALSARQPVCKPPYAGKDCGGCCYSSKQKKWIIAGAITVAGIAVAIASIKLWGTARNSCSSSTAVPTGGVNINYGPAQLNFTFSDTSDNGDWTGSVVTPQDTVLVTASLQPLGTAQLVVGPPSVIGTYTVGFTAGFSNPSPNPTLSLGQVVITTSNGSSTTFVAPDRNFNAGQEYTFDLVYSPSVFP
jgi:hypothetical protein